MSPWRALRDAVTGLVSRPAATGIALLAGGAAGLAARAGRVAASRLYASGEASAALAMWVLGGTLGALLFACGLAAAFIDSDVAVEAGGVAGGFDRLRLALRRGVAALSLGALERVLYATLLLGAGATTVRALARYGASRGVVLALGAAIAGPALLAALTLLAWRVAIVSALRGVPSHWALGRGLSALFTRLPSLLGLTVAGAVASAPLWWSAICLARLPAAGGGALPHLFAALGEGAFTMASALWLYGALLALLRSAEDPLTAADSPSSP